MNFFFWNTFILYIYVYAEIFYSLVFFSIFRGLKFFTINISKKLNIFFFKGMFFSTYVSLLIFYTLTLKTASANNTILILLFIYFFLNKGIEEGSKINFMFLNFNIFFFFFFINYINSIVIFFLLIEVYSLLFYFIFLNFNKTTTNTDLLKLKNSLLLYLFSNFFTTILFIISIAYLVEVCGTLNFIELLYLNNIQINWKLFIIVLTFVLKLALPGFHYIKLEIYKYLSIHSVIYFSVMTLYVNYMLMLFFFNHNFIVQILIYYKFIIILLLLTFFFLIQKIQINNISEFIAYSGFATNNLIILNYIV